MKAESAVHGASKRDAAEGHVDETSVDTLRKERRPARPAAGEVDYVELRKKIVGKFSKTLAYLAK